MEKLLFQAVAPHINATYFGFNSAQELFDNEASLR
jgi:hypothetical protein